MNFGECFTDYRISGHLEDFAKRLIKESFQCATISGAAKHFHERYKDKKRRKSLMQNEKALLKRTTELLDTPLAKLQPDDIVFLVAAVVYRFRNNIFYGKKGIPFWPEYKPELAHCTEAM